MAQGRRGKSVQLPRRLDAGGTELITTSRRAGGGCAESVLLARGASSVADVASRVEHLVQLSWLRSSGVGRANGGSGERDVLDRDADCVDLERHSAGYPIDGCCIHLARRWTTDRRPALTESGSSGCRGRSRPRLSPAPATWISIWGRSSCTCRRRAGGSWTADDAAAICPSMASASVGIVELPVQNLMSGLLEAGGRGHDGASGGVRS